MILISLLGRSVLKHLLDFSHIEKFSVSTYTSNQLQNHITNRNKEQKTKHATKLFMTSKTAEVTCALVSPELDIDYIINNDKNISECTKARRIIMDVPLLVKNLKAINSLKKEIDDIKNMIIQTNTVVKNLKTESASSDQINAVINERRELKNKAKDLREKLLIHEEAAIPDLVRLPNKTPDILLKDKILFEYNIPKELSFPMKSHIELGKNQCLKFSTVIPLTCYLYNKAADVELALSDYFYDYMIKAGFAYVIGPDFCKSVVLEGCGKTLDSIDSSITLEAESKDHSVHLCGNASLESFAASFMKTVVHRKALPIQYFNIGCYYKPLSEKIEQNLFSMIQTIAVKVFVASLPSESMKEFSKLVNIIEQCYKNMNLPFRIVQVAGHNLKLAESAKLEFDLWSPYRNKYLNVGYVSLCTDYISRRLLIKYQKENNEKDYLHIIDATVISLSDMIGCIMENFQTSEGTFNVPDILKPYLNKVYKD